MRFLWFAVSNSNRCIVDAGCHIPEGLVVGEDRDLDQKRFFVSDDGITLITAEHIARL